MLRAPHPTDPGLPGGESRSGEPRRGRGDPRPLGALRCGSSAVQRGAGPRRVAGREPSSDVTHTCSPGRGGSWSCRALDSDQGEEGELWPGGRRRQGFLLHGQRSGPAAPRAEDLPGSNPYLGSAAQETNITMCRRSRGQSLSFSNSGSGIRQSTENTKEDDGKSFRPPDFRLVSERRTKRSETGMIRICISLLGKLRHRKAKKRAQGHPVRCRAGVQP